MYCEIIIVKLINKYITLHNYHFLLIGVTLVNKLYIFLVVIPFKISFLSKFQVYNTVLLTTGTV